ncbi:MAG TPA: EAL domain-containing protein [Acidimicrobiales bacterium]|jgi:diguanylate cyclase (GGDEF)-like protein/PAS domain S-box-containing protein
MSSRRTFKPLQARGRRPIYAIVIVFALFSALSVGLSIRETSRSRNQGAVVEVAARQRTLAERYVNDVLLVQDGRTADPSTTADLLARSGDALLNGGIAPEVAGDDDEIKVPAATDAGVRAQLEQARRLVTDLTATGQAMLADQSVADVPMTAHETIAATDPVMRLRVLETLVSNVSLNSARTIATRADDNIASLITVQVVLGALGFIAALVLVGAMLAAARRQTAHFRSLVTSSTDLVVVFGSGACVYTSESVSAMLGRPDSEMLGDGLASFIHADDQPLVRPAIDHGEPREIAFRMLDRFGEERWLEAHVTDLRRDRQVRGIVFNARDITERVRLEEQLTQQAFNDGLTGLANRALFRDRLDRALARSTRSRDVLTVMMVDLDGFKQVNDTLGHDAGDGLLRDVASRFATVIRTTDTLARFGGDEFVLLLEGSDEAHASSLADRLLDAISDPFSVAGRQLSVSASIGIVVHQGGPGDADELLRHADVAMYAAKEAGRGRYQVFQFHMARELGELLGLEHELRTALRKGELTVHYQPEFDIASGAVVGVEALARWESRTRGSVAPARFIPVAEATGLILPLGEFVLREACEQAAKWCSDGLVSDGFVTWVNVSAKQLGAGGMAELVRQVLDRCGLPARSLGLEVTETAIVAEGTAGELARAELEDIHDQGVHIAIDDFGTGFSSLAQLRRFPVDVIKIDGSFVQGVEHDRKAAAITANIVNLAQLLGLRTIAEGIESQGQLASIQQLGCDVAQGFHFAHPVPADALTARLAESAGQRGSGCLVEDDQELHLAVVADRSGAA